MEHKEIIMQLDAFLSDYLPPGKTRKVLKHLESCPQCREELDVKLLVRLTSGNLETSNPFDLKHSMEDILNKRKKAVRNLMVFLVFLCVLLVAGIIVFFVLTR